MFNENEEIPGTHGGGTTATAGSLSSDSTVEMLSDMATMATNPPGEVLPTRVSEDQTLWFLGDPPTMSTNGYVISRHNWTRSTAYIHAHSPEASTIGKFVKWDFWADHMGWHETADTDAHSGSISLSAYERSNVMESITHLGGSTLTSQPFWLFAHVGTITSPDPILNSVTVTNELEHVVPNPYTYMYGGVLSNEGNALETKFSYDCSSMPNHPYQFTSQMIQTFSAQIVTDLKNEVLARVDLIKTTTPLDANASTFEKLTGKEAAEGYVSLGAVSTSGPAIKIDLRDLSTSSPEAAFSVDIPGLAGGDDYGAPPEVFDPDGGPVDDVDILGGGGPDFSPGGPGVV